MSCTRCTRPSTQNCSFFSAGRSCRASLCSDHAVPHGAGFICPRHASVVEHVEAVRAAPGTGALAPQQPVKIDWRVIVPIALGERRGHTRYRKLVNGYFPGEERLVGVRVMDETAEGAIKRAKHALVSGPYKDRPQDVDPENQARAEVFVETDLDFRGND